VRKYVRGYEIRCINTHVKIVFSFYVHEIVFALLPSNFYVGFTFRIFRLFIVYEVTDINIDKRRFGTNLAVLGHLFTPLFKAYFFITEIFLSCLE
jgi:hypothetical protein